MKFKTLTLEAYGDFHNHQVAFSKKLNLIYGPNESGKSTLLSALDTLLLGIFPKSETHPYYPLRGEGLALSATFFDEETLGARRTLAYQAQGFIKRVNDQKALGNQPLPWLPEALLKSKAYWLDHDTLKQASHYMKQYDLMALMVEMMLPQGSLSLQTLTQKLEGFQKKYFTQHKYSKSLIKQLEAELETLVYNKKEALAGARLIDEKMVMRDACLTQIRTSEERLASLMRDKAYVRDVLPHYHLKEELDLLSHKRRLTHMDERIEASCFEAYQQKRQKDEDLAKQHAMYQAKLEEINLLKAQETLEWTSKKWVTLDDAYAMALEEAAGHHFDLNDLLNKKAKLKQHLDRLTDDLVYDQDGLNALQTAVLAYSSDHLQAQQPSKYGRYDLMVLFALMVLTFGALWMKSPYAITVSMVSLGGVAIHVFLRPLIKKVQGVKNADPILYKIKAIQKTLLKGQALEGLVHDHITQVLGAFEDYLETQEAYNTVYAKWLNLVDKHQLNWSINLSPKQVQNDLQCMWQCKEKSALLNMEEIKVNKLLSDLEDAILENDRQSDALRTQVITLFGTSDTSQVRDMVVEARQLKSKIENLKSQMVLSEKIMAEHPLRPGVTSMVVIEEALEDQQKQLGHLRESLQTLKVELEHMPWLDPVDVQIHIDEVTAKIKQAQWDHDQILLAKRVVEEAQKRLHQTTSPKFIDMANSYLALLTHDQHEKILIQSSGTIEVLNAEGLTLAFGHLSTGTQSQVMLALKLSMVDVLDPEATCPLLIDDALVFHDQERLASAMTLLDKVAETRQVIMATCQASVLSLAQEGNAHLVLL